VTRLIVRRLAQALAVACLTGVVLTLATPLLPGDPAILVLGPRTSAELAARLRVEMGLDQPLWKQAGGFLLGALQGDLGRDFWRGLPVSGLVAAALPHTLLLAGTAMALAAGIGIPLGALCAWRAGGRLDRCVRLLAVVSFTMPGYVVGLLLLLVFTVQLGWFPAIGAGQGGGAWELARHLVLPAVTLAIGWTGYLARLVRDSVLRVLGSDFIRSARAYGVPPHRILLRHALRPALAPVVAILGVGLGSLLGGAVFVEVIFNRPGLGRLIFDAIGSRNLPVLRGGVFVAALLYVLCNLAAELALAALDPRQRVAQAD
jgi:peptide/nickel transport system permease protein